MRNTKILACLSLMTMLSACGTPDQGYYDRNGNYVPNNPYNRNAHDHAPLPGGTHPEYDDTHYASTHATWHYDRAGYYDQNGYYIEHGPSVSSDMLPPHGMCRVWFPERAVMDQPPIEDCDGIRGRVPAGAYVIYGG